MSAPARIDYERGRDAALEQYAKHGARRLEQLLERVALYGIADRGIVTRHAEFWRGFRTEASGLTALASRRAPR